MGQGYYYCNYTKRECVHLMWGYWKEGEYDIEEMVGLMNWGSKDKITMIGDYGDKIRYTGSVLDDDLDDDISDNEDTSEEDLSDDDDDNDNNNNNNDSIKDWKILFYDEEFGFWDRQVKDIPEILAHIEAINFELNLLSIELIRIILDYADYPKQTFPRTLTKR